MVLQAEYFQRHGINIPQVCHTRTPGSLILRADDPKETDFLGRWLIVTMSWREAGNHPGSYDTQFLLPIHNGYKSGNYFTSFRSYPSTLNLQYEVFEPFFLDFSQSHGKLQAISDAREVALTSWEIFLYCYDGYLAAKQSSPALRESIAKSIDFEAPFLERFFSYGEAVDRLMTEQRPVFDRYETCIHIHAKRPLSWLANLVNGD